MATHDPVRMNLYLSSYLLGRETEALRAMAGNGPVKVIANALDFFTDTSRRTGWIESEVADLAGIGIAAEPLDLRDYFGKPGDLATVLDGVSMLWVTGGNTFLLRQAMHHSGLDRYLHRRKSDPTFTYAGYSAGVCVLSPSLEGIHLADKPEAKADGYEGKVIWDGLGILDDYIVPHYRCDHPESPAMEAVVAFYEALGFEYRTISDGQVILGKG